MYKVLATTALGIGLLFAPAGVQAAPGPATGIKASTDVQEVGYKHRRWYKHRHWKRGHHHHNRYRYYRKRKGIHIHVH